MEETIDKSKSDLATTENTEVEPNVSLQITYTDNERAIVLFPGWPLSEAMINCLG